jgi:hypothetical protein
VEKLLPSFKEIVTIEEETLKLLHDRLSQWQTFAHLSGLIKQRWSTKLGHAGTFQFLIYWDVPYIGMECRLILGADIWKQKIGASISNASYCIFVVEGTNEPKKILRKFHFDYVTERGDQREPHPRFHLQYCGGLPPAAESLGITNDLMIPLEPQIKGPRIFFNPMTLGLLMNMAFYEFPCDDTEKIRKSGEWQNLVRQNERKILKPFYGKCATLAGRDNAIFFDEVYVH